MTDARSPIRALRAALFAAVCVSLAAVGHSSMSAHDLPPGSLLTAFAGTAGLAWLAGGRRRGTPAIGAGLLAVQAALHLTFQGAGPAHRHGHGGAYGMAPGMPPGTPPDTVAGTLPVPAASVSVSVSASVGMLAVHALAAAVCALWLARGEAAFFRLARAVGALAFTPLRPPPAPLSLPGQPRPPHPGAPASRRHRGVVLAHTLSRRGPPRHPVPRATAPGASV
ncbi:hypothetical protein [Streptomyces sp. NPDC050856]|uniref:hypothetical protein n=1 Tax=Streptomyces sp. NPDC050856 TaxID=3154939 RepID=UPI0033C44F19